jgi:hypothetical protein
MLAGLSSTKPAASLTSSPGPVKLPKLPTSPTVHPERKSTWGTATQMVAVLGLGEPYVVFVLGAARLLLLGYGVACLLSHAWGYGAAFITHCVFGVLGLMLGVHLQVPPPTPSAPLRAPLLSVSSPAWRMCGVARWQRPPHSVPAVSTC